jgi:RNA polymerase sigma-70 factor (ECF subfamily)
MLESTEESVTSALKRARATLDGGLEPRRRQAAAPAPDSPEERRVVARYVDAFVAHDVDGIVALLTEDAWIKMPPMPFEYHGRDAAARFFAAIRPALARASEIRLLPTRANGQPALAGYRRNPENGTFRCIGLFVLTLAGEQISEVVHFESDLIEHFGMTAILGS